MQTRMALQKKPEQLLSTVNKNPQNQSDTTQIAKKPNVRTTEYRKMMEIFLTDPDSVTREEFLLFQKVVGYSRALRLLNEGKRRKQLRKMEVRGTTLKKPSIEKDNEASDNAEQKVVQKKDSDLVVRKGRGELSQIKESRNDTSSGTGLPGSLRSGLEKLSGVDLSDVNVYKNSDKPQQVGALAYTQGKDIHIASGQEKHLPHEGWHAVQQKQGRVEPTLQMKTGTLVNDNAGLEKEADIMGSRAAKEGSQTSTIQQLEINSNIKQENKVIQRITQEEAMKLSKQNTHEKNNSKVEKKDNSQTDDILDGIQTVLDVVGFVPGAGDIADGANTGICIARKDWVGAVLSGLAMIPVVGSAIAAPMKTIFKAVSKVGSKIGGISNTVQKAIKLLVKLLGGAKKVSSKLIGFLNTLKGILRKIPDLINRVADLQIVKWLAGKKGIKAIISFAKKIRSGVETVCKKADEVFKTVRNAVTKSSTKSGTELARKLGKEGEDAAGIIKAKERIPSLSGTAKYRIPDELLHDQKILREIKNVGSQSYTNQLRDFNAWAKQNGYQFILEVRPGAKLSGPLKKAIDNGDIILKNIRH
jgi:hypothetical protein